MNQSRSTAQLSGTLASSRNPHPIDFKRMLNQQLKHLSSEKENLCQFGGSKLPQQQRSNERLLPRAPLQKQPSTKQLHEQMAATNSQALLNFIYNFNQAQTWRNSQSPVKKEKVVAMACQICKQKEILLYQGVEQQTQSNELHGNCQQCGVFICSSSQSLPSSKPPFQPELPLDVLLNSMISKQNRGRLFNPSAFYLSSRRHLVDWMCEMGEDLRFSQSTIHFSIAVFDGYLSQPQVEAFLNGLGLAKGRQQLEMLQFVALVAILISAKFHEKTYPGVQKLNSLIQAPFAYEDYIAMEGEVMNALRWDIYFITAFDFVQHFLVQGIIFTSDQVKKDGKFHAPSDLVVQNACKFAEFYAEMCLQEHAFLQYDPFSLACGIVMAARKIVRVRDKWPREMKMMTMGRKTEAQVKRCMVHIFEFYEQTFPEHCLKNQGISSVNTEKSESRRQTLEKPRKTHLESDMTTPTDVETPAKDLLLSNKLLQKSAASKALATGEKQLQSHIQIRKPDSCFNSTNSFGFLQNNNNNNNKSRTRTEVVATTQVKQGGNEKRKSLGTTYESNQSFQSFQSGSQNVKLRQPQIQNIKETSRESRNSGQMMSKLIIQSNQMIKIKSNLSRYNSLQDFQINRTQSRLRNSKKESNSTHRSRNNSQYNSKLNLNISKGELNQSQKSAQAQQPQAIIQAKLPTCLQPKAAIHTQRNQEPSSHASIENKKTLDRNGSVSHLAISNALKQNLGSAVGQKLTNSKNLGKYAPLRQNRVQSKSKGQLPPSQKPPISNGRFSMNFPGKSQVTYFSNAEGRQHASFAATKSFVKQ